MAILLEIIRPLGNAIAKYVFSNKYVEKDSVLSDALGGVTILILTILSIWLLVKVVG